MPEVIQKGFTQKEIWIKEGTTFETVDEATAQLITDRRDVALEDEVQSISSTAPIHELLAEKNGFTSTRKYDTYEDFKTERKLRKGAEDLELTIRYARDLAIHNGWIRQTEIKESS
jgi:hypothetical protein